jgi:hypothetical protein
MSRPDVGGEAAGDEGALAHAAGELVRVLADPVGGVGEPGLGHEVDGALLGLGAGGDVVVAQRLLDVVADRPHRVEVAHRVLGDEPDVGAAQFGVPLLARVGDVLTVEDDPAAGDMSVAGQQAEDAHRGGGLAGAGFADDSDGLAGPDVEVHAEDGGQRLLVGAEGDVHTAHRQQGSVVHRVRSLGSRASLRVSPSRMNPSTVSASAPAG